MQKLFFILCLALTITSCKSNEPDKSKALAALTKYLFAKTEGKWLIDSLYITEIDTLTPQTSIYIKIGQLKTGLEVYKDSGQYYERKLDKELNLMKAYGIANNKAGFNATKKDFDAIQVELLAMAGRVQIIEDSIKGLKIQAQTADSTTFLDYLVTFKFQVRNQTGETERGEGEVVVTKEYGIIPIDKYK